MELVTATREPKVDDAGAAPNWEPKTVTDALEVVGKLGWPAETTARPANDTADVNVRDRCTLSARVTCAAPEIAGFIMPTLVAMELSDAHLLAKEVLDCTRDLTEFSNFPARLAPSNVTLEAPVVGEFEGEGELSIGLSLETARVNVFRDVAKKTVAAKDKDDRTPELVF